MLTSSGSAGRCSHLATPR